MSDYGTRKVLGSTNGGFLSWLRHPQRGLPYLIFSIVVILIALPFLTHYYISAFDDISVTSSQSRYERTGKYASQRALELKSQIDELYAIKTSVSNELLELEKKRQSLLNDISGYTMAIDGLKQSHQQTSDELSRLRITFTNLQVEQLELLRNNLPIIAAPKRLFPPHEDVLAPIAVTEHWQRCQMHNCFDYSRCSVTSGFPVYLYPPDENLISSGLDLFVKQSVASAFDSSPHTTYDPLIACIYVVLIPDNVQQIFNLSDIERQLTELQFWRESGVNHLLVSISRQPSAVHALTRLNTGAAMIAQSVFYRDLFRTGFDVILPPVMGIARGDVWHQLPLLVPARRKYLLSFVGEVVYPSVYSSPRAAHSIENDSLHSSRQDLFDDAIIGVLKALQSDYELDSFNFQFICSVRGKLPSVFVEWSRCGVESDEDDLLRSSTFRLILAPIDRSLLSTTMLQSAIYLSLKYGAVPVVLGDYVQLPFHEFIDWPRAVIRLPKARITELHFILRSYTDADILELRRHGRFLFEKFFASANAVVSTMLAILRTRLKIPAFPIHDEPSPSIFNESFVPVREPVMDSMVEVVDEMLGPVEPPKASPRYYRNFTFSEDGFNLPGDPFHSYPYTPFQPSLPGDAKFIGSSYGFRPIGSGEGGTGKEFSEALGGNSVREQFTVVILTYEREAVLFNAISRLKGLPHLNKVVVVWNSERAPSEDLQWPDIGVDVHVVRTARNSLNNRFLPYDAIETEAVLSVDDDAHLRHDEIIFGFRVWREARDRIVGFPGRYHAWDIEHDNWLYNSNYSCELSIVLTGAAFFHKYYMYVYSYVMSQAIRDKVDEYLNCEDLAMNFLVAHITRKPPIKVTSRWTFRCAGCPKSLSVEESHFAERHKCINFFVQVYGYMPLLNTQFRADSVLFKTRIPHDKQKCFKFI